jgi:hydrogenase large subunit
MDKETMLEQKYSYPNNGHQLSDALMQEVNQKNKASKKTDEDPFSRLGGSLAFHCTANLAEKRVIETASMATAFRGYEALLPGRDLSQVGLVSSTASGICGGVHATASALCLEMALGLKPPPLGIVIRNLLLSCQYLNDNTMHLYVLSGPDYSQQVIQATNPELWNKAQQSPTKSKLVHGYSHIGDIMLDLNKPNGTLYGKALEMIKTARKAYAVLGGKYPHSESIVPGGVTITPNLEQINSYIKTLDSFTDYTAQTIAIWDDIFDFMLAENPLYEQVGKSEASMVDFGQWDHDEYYDGSYANCDQWGEQRWSTPGAIINGELVTTKLSQLNIGLEEFVDHSYYKSWVDESAKHYHVKTDPLGNTVSPHHPWNKKIIPNFQDSQSGQAYSWGTSLTWNKNVFEVGAYARMYISALAKKIPHSQYVASTGTSLELLLPRREMEDVQLTWNIPKIWNAFERNRARAYALAFNLAVTWENTERARALIEKGLTAVSVPLDIPEIGKSVGVGLWGAGRGFLAHWAVINAGRIENYQISVPSRVNASPRSPWGELGPCEQAVLNTPIIEKLSIDKDFAGIDIQRAIQSFDPCMTCTTHILVENTDIVLNRVVDTSFPI